VTKYHAIAPAFPWLSAAGFVFMPTYRSSTLPKVAGRPPLSGAATGTRRPKFRMWPVGEVGGGVQRDRSR
jgi:hypothetical protein